MDHDCIRNALVRSDLSLLYQHLTLKHWKIHFDRFVLTGLFLTFFFIINIFIDFSVVPSKFTVHFQMEQIRK